jgi:hypothetical protein
MLFGLRLGRQAKSSGGLIYCIDTHCIICDAFRNVCVTSLSLEEDEFRDVDNLDEGESGCGNFRD